MFLRGTSSAEQLNHLVSRAVSILKTWTAQIIRHSLDFNIFYTIQKYFFQIFKISSY